jgi:beta propeller repeat protein
MKDKSKSYFIALATAALVLFLILVPSAASALPLTITETQITTSGNSSNADIYEGKTVWQDTRNGGNPDIYMYDTSTKKETRITKSGSAVNPAIYGNLIVWQDTRNGGSDIYKYDLSSKKETRITTSGSSSNPDIYSNKIVWDGGGIFLYDLSTGKVTKIAESYSDPDGMGVGYGYADPAIYGNRIAWVKDEYTSDTYYSIEVYDLSTKQVTYSRGGGDVEFSCRSPDINNNRVVWAEWTVDGTNIGVYDFSTKKETYIATTTLPGLQNHAIYSNRIVWDNSIYDLSTKNETKITTGGSASNPAIYGDRIVWQDSRNGKSNIYMATLSSKPAIVAAFYAPLTSGKVPLTVKFTDKSTGSPTSWYWNFGDKYTSTVKNPVHKYTKAGKYTVTLKVTSAAGSNTVTKSSYINVLTPPVAAFSAYPVSGKTVKFTDKSTNNPTSWYWNFGDKTTSKLQSPVHKYTQAGKKYTVSLTVKNAAGSSTAKKTITTLR